MISLKSKNHGFTIIELLIVIIIIGILALIGVVAYGNAQQSARNSKRQSDISSLHTAIEAYTTQNSGVYPSLAEMNDAAAGGFRETNLKGVPAETFTDPKAANSTLAGARTANQYAYVATPAGCDNSTTDCTGYTLIAVPEGGGADITKASLQ